MVGTISNSADAVRLETAPTEGMMNRCTSELIDVWGSG